MRARYRISKDLRESEASEEPSVRPRRRREASTLSLFMGFLPLLFERGDFGGH